MRLLMVLLLAIVVSGCASVGTASPKLQAVKTIGVISSVGDQLTLTKAGLTGVRNSDQSFPIESWGIDDLIVSRATMLLNKRFQVQSLTYRRADFATIHESSSNVIVNLLRNDQVKELVRTEVTPQGLDAYLVITKAKSAYSARGRSVAGLGIISQQAVFDSYIQIHALYEIRLVSGSDFEVLDRRLAMPSGNTEMVRLAGPSRLVDDTFLPTANGVAGNQKLRGGIADLIESSLPALLQSMGLVDQP